MYKQRRSHICPECGCNKVCKGQCRRDASHLSALQNLCTRRLRQREPACLEAWEFLPLLELIVPPLRVRQSLNWARAQAVLPHGQEQICAVASSQHVAKMEQMLDNAAYWI